MSAYIDDALAKAKASGPSPLRSVPPPEPSDAERRILMSIEWNCALAEAMGKRGDLFAFLDRVEEKVRKLRELLND